MKTILPWILVVAFAAGAGTLYFSNAAKDAELAKTREQAQQADSLKTQLDEAQKQVASQADQITSLGKDNEELLRLRGQVRQLNDDKQQLNKQLQMAQSQVDRSQAQIQQVQANASANANAIAEQRVQQLKQTQQAAAVCINNLRQIDAAKQQWALVNNKQPESVPTPMDIVPYLANRQMPQCPAGGTYILNPVRNAPTCSIPGHVLQ